MIQFLLFFALGFATAALLAVAAVPAVWRRAVALTRREVEASLPMTAAELRAERDRQRAEHAIALRRLEIDARNHADKAARRAIEIGRQHETIRALSEERDSARAALESVEAERDRLRQEVGAGDAKVAELTAKLEKAVARVEALSAEVEQLSAFGEEESLKASNRQIELLARESDIETLTTELAALKSARREQERRLRELVADNRAGQDALRNERKRLAEAEKKIEKLMSAVSDREEKLERRERERLRLREELKAAEAGRRAADAELAELRAEVLRLEALLAAAGTDGGRPSAVDGAEALREQIADIAARIVDMTAREEGPSSPIERTLAGAKPALNKGTPRSLADRIGALRESAPSA